MFIVIVIFTPTQKPSKTYKSKPKAFIYENRPIYSVPDSTSEIYQITSDYGLLIFVYKDKDGWTAFYNPFFNNDSLRYVQTKYVTYDENKFLNYASKISRNEIREDGLYMPLLIKKEHFFLVGGFPEGNVVPGSHVYRPIISKKGEAIIPGDVTFMYKLKHRGIKMSSRFLSKLILMVFIFLPFSASAISVGDTVPSFKARSIDGNNNVTVNEYRGKVVLIDFWASWCPPCLKSFPLYDELRREIGTTDFEILAINVDENTDDAKKFLSKHPVN